MCSRLSQKSGSIAEVYSYLNKYLVILYKKDLNLNLLLGHFIQKLGTLIFAYAYHNMSFPLHVPRDPSIT